MRRLTLQVSFITLMAKPSLKFVLPNISEISISYFFEPIFLFWVFSWIPILRKWMFCKFKVFFFLSFLLIMISRVIINDQYLFVWERERERGILKLEYQSRMEAGFILEYRSTFQFLLLAANLSFFGILWYFFKIQYYFSFYIFISQSTDLYIFGSQSIDLFIFGSQSIWFRHF